MSAAETIERLARAKVIAVIRVERQGETAPAVAALAAGGLRAIELTWTSPEPAAELAAARAQHGEDLLLGAGTLRSANDVEAAVEAGADFLVSPHFERGLCEVMVASGRLALPGVFTPSEVAAALDAGADAVKLFPSSIGGVDHMKALRGPFPGLLVVPTGGITSANAAEWLTAGALAVGAASELCPPAAVAAAHWDELTAAAQGFLAAVESAGQADAMSRRFIFIGVSTGGSSIMRVFPRWRAALGLGDDVEIEGWDLPIDAPPGTYSEAVERLAVDPGNIGALVTTHKLAIMRAAADRFDELDEDARLLGEVSCISKRGGRLRGAAKDPATAAAALDAIIEPNHFSEGGESLVLGAGGAGTALVVNLGARREDRPARIVATDTDPERLAHLRSVAERAGADDVLETRRAEGNHDELVASLAEGSLLVNATGMGKDRPGSPISDAAVFPRRSVAWELNYRGELAFKRQAERQREEREVTVADGWGYFVRGWAAVIEEVFERPIGADELELLGHEAAATRENGAEEER